MLYKKCQIIVLIPIFLFHVVTSFAQQRDSRVREYLSPIHIVWQQESQLIQGAEYLLRSGHGQANLVNNELCKLSSTGQQHPAILFDFGKELQGGLQIVTGMPASHAPVTIRVRLGESVSEAMCDIDEVNGATNDHAMRDLLLGYLGLESWKSEIPVSGLPGLTFWTIPQNCTSKRYGLFLFIKISLIKVRSDATTSA